MNDVTVMYRVIRYPNKGTYMDYSLPDRFCGVLYESKSIRALEQNTLVTFKLLLVICI